VGDHSVGYLYNMIHGGHVLQYQSGFDYELSDSTSWRPGVICHALAIEHYLSLGMETYDFLAGDQRYKKELSTASDELTWSTLQRPRLKFDMEQRLRKLEGFIRRSSRSKGGEPE
jgi:CelD/BcsL family acetyltransferase involved in cellulose biosynthesis